MRLSGYREKSLTPALQRAPGALPCSPLQSGLLNWDALIVSHVMGL